MVGNSSPGIADKVLAQAWVINTTIHQYHFIPEYFLNFGLAANSSNMSRLASVGLLITAFIVADINVSMKNPKTYKYYLYVDGKTFIFSVT